MSGRWLLELSDDLRAELEQDATYWGVDADVFAERVLRLYLSQPIVTRLPSNWETQGVAS